MAKKEHLQPDYIFESSWEVCNKVGGIYTVLSTRAKTLQDQFKDKILFIGPDLWREQHNPDFIESASLLKAWKKYAAEKEQLLVRVGRWNVPGKPIAILVDFNAYYACKNDVYFRMWEKYRVDSIAAYGDYDESSMFAYATGLVMESLYRFLKLDGQHVVAHLNEWMLGMAALYIQDKVPAIATIFTTHATSIGRSICGNSKPLYSHLERYDGDSMARELNMEAKHSIEKQAAIHVDCFTTVSEITGKEAEQLLNKKPDIITPNGFEANFVPKGAAFTRKRKQARKDLIQVAQQLTGERINDDALLIATSGRYEYKNKGIDVYIEAINRVRLAQPERQVIAFIMVPAWIRGSRPDLQERLLKNKVAKTPLYAPFCTHELMDFYNDRVIGYLQHLNFMNQSNDAVKIIFVPSYLKGNDGIFNLDYYDLLIGMDLTIFPSYYEPWGYTPLESIAFSIPTITTNLAGFGLWAETLGASGKDLKKGVEVLQRTDDNYFEVAEEIKDSVLTYASLRDKDVEEIRTAAKELSGQASWEHFISYYYEAYHIALTNARKRNKQ